MKPPPVRPRPSPVSRRTFLRGLGTALALPALPSAMPRAAWATAATAVSRGPLRMAFLFVPNGVHMDQWRPADEGEGFAMPPILAPLEPYRRKLLVLSGLAQDAGFPHGDGAGDHARSASVFLTGAHPVKTSGRGIRVGMSADQVAAAALQGQTRFSSLELGIEPGRQAGNCDSGYSCAYSHNISWRSPTTPATKEINPRLVFERLFGSGSPHQRGQAQAKLAAERRSILDFVQDDAHRMQKRLAKRDRLKLDEYLDGIRDIELRMDRADDPLVDVDPLHRPRGIPADYGQHVRLMGDLMVLAFQSDLTRVVTLMLGNAGSQLSYPTIGVNQGHHTLSHHQNRPENLRQITQINRYHVEQLGYILGRLDATDQANADQQGGTLLDNSMIVYGSAISDGNRHNHDDLPILLAGGGGGHLKGGRHLQYSRPTPLMNLYLKLLHIAGIDQQRLGDSTAPLTRLGDT